ncbi:MAG: protein kinase domain-containing protein [Hyphomicrobium sp.]
MTNLIALQNGTELVGDYRIDRVLGAGGFGITYLADEIALARPVTIKEYFPADFAARADGLEAAPRSQNCAGDYRWGLDRFIEEAQTLARFNHPNIVRVYRYFRANNTGYMVLHFEEGQNLKGWLKGLGRAPRQKELDSLLTPLLDALEIIHKSDYLHRDIAPDNIIVRKNGEPVLIDFGSARGEIASHSKTVSALVKPGYSPYEQYAETSRQQGPWTDIYALGATLYHLVAGKRPPDAPSRMVKDELVPARDAALSAYRPGFLRAIDRALALPVEARPQSIAAWRGDLLAPDDKKPGWFGVSRVRDEAPRPQPLAASAPAKRPAGTLPPQPDAPGPQGGMLDFLDGLRGRNGEVKAAANTNVPPASAAPLASAPAAAVAGGSAATLKLDEDMPAVRIPSIFRRKSGSAKSTPAAAAASPAKANLPAVVSKPPRPRKIKSGGRSWRPMLFKLLIGVGVASGAVAMQDRLPRFENRGQGVISSQAPVQSALIGQLRGHTGPVSALAYSSDGRTLVTSGKDGSLKVWNINGSSLIRTIELDDGPATSLALSGPEVLTGHANGQVVLWNYERAEKVAAFKRSEAEVWSLTYAGGSNRFAAAGPDGKVAIWDTAQVSAPLQIMDAHESIASAVAFGRSERGPLLASGGADKQVKLWNLDTFDSVRRYRGHGDYLTALTFSADGKMLASASLDGAIRIWSTASNRTLRRLTGHKGKVGSLAFSPAGDALVSAGEDGQVRIWDFKRGRTAKTLAGHAGGVRAVAFSPDGQTIASAGDDGIVRLWSNPMARVATN